MCERERLCSLLLLVYLYDGYEQKKSLLRSDPTCPTLFCSVLSVLTTCSFCLGEISEKAKQ